MALPFAKIILTHLTAELRPRGFRKNGQTFVREVEDCCQIVNLQASQFGTREDQRYTLNFAVHCELLRAHGKEPSKLKEYDGEWRARIGAFSFDRRDKWWVVSSEADAEQAGCEMVTTLPLALEAMNGISTYDAMIRIPPGAGASSDDPPGWCLWHVINAAREREGLPPSVGFQHFEGWRDSWHARQYPEGGG